MKQKQLQELSSSSSPSAKVVLGAGAGASVSAGASEAKYPIASPASEDSCVELSPGQLGPINWKIEDLNDTSRLEFHCPEKVATEVWMKADEDEMHKLPILFKICLEYVVKEIIQDRGFALRRMNKLMRVDGVIEQQKASWIRSGHVWQTFDPATYRAPGMTGKMTLKAAVEDFLVPLTRKHGINIPQEEFDELIRQNVSPLTVYEAIDRGRVLSRVALNVALPLACLLVTAMTAAPAATLHEIV